jgi:hypothetical protein
MLLQNWLEFVPHWLRIQFDLYWLALPVGQVITIIIRSSEGFADTLAGGGDGSGEFEFVVCHGHS